jgi:hypothetical protein
MGTHVGQFRKPAQRSRLIAWFPEGIHRDVGLARAGSTI